MTLPTPLRIDAEKQQQHEFGRDSSAPPEKEDASSIDDDQAAKSPWWMKVLKALAVESRGIVPTLPEERTDRRYWKIFFIWLSGNCNILS